MNRRQAARLQEQLKARWPDATEVDVVADSEGARIQMRVHGENYKFSVADGGVLLLLLLTGSAALPGLSSGS